MHPLKLSSFFSLSLLLWRMVTQSCPNSRWRAQSSRLPSLPKTYDARRKFRSPQRPCLPDQLATQLGVWIPLVHYNDSHTQESAILSTTVYLSKKIQNRARQGKSYLRQNLELGEFQTQSFCVLREALPSQHQSVAISKVCQPRKLWCPDLCSRFHYIGMIDWIIFNQCGFDFLFQQHPCSPPHPRQADFKWPKAPAL